MPTLGKTTTTGDNVGVVTAYIYGDGPYTASENGTIDSISFYLINAVGTEKITLGLYADSAGVPGSKVGQTVEGTAADGWNTLNASGSFSITSGQSYWLAYWIDTDLQNPNGPRRATGVTGTYVKYKGSQTYSSTLPASFPASPSSLDNYATAIYATYTPTGGGTATTYTFTGPTSGNLNEASTNFTVDPDDNYTGTITPASDGTGTFNPTSLSWSGTHEAKTFTYTPTSAAGSPHTLSCTSDPALTDPATIDYTVNVPALASGTLSVSSVADGVVNLSVTDATGGTGSYTYQFHRGTTPDFTPAVGTQIGEAGASTTYQDTGRTNGTAYYYKCVVDDGSTTATSNMIAGVPASSQGWLFVGDSFGEYVWNGSGTELNDYAVGRQLQAAMDAAKPGNAILNSVANEAVSGASASEWVSTHLTGAMASSPAATYPYVVIALGPNDSFEEATAAAFKSSMQSLITTLRANSYTKIFLCYPPFLWWGTLETEAEQARLAAYCGKIDELASENSECYAIEALFAHTMNHLADYPDEDDNIHPLAAGGPHLAAAIAAEVIDALYGSGGYTYGDEDASKVLTTATGAGTYQPVAAADVQAGVAVGVSPAVGTFVVPLESKVEEGTEYGNAAEFIGTLENPTNAEIAAAVWAYANRTLT